MAKYPLLFFFIRVTDDHFEHETVHLGFGQGISPFLLDRVLGCQDHERLFQQISIIADCNLPLLHGFQQGALHLGRGPVDFICKDKIGKDGPFPHHEFLFFLAVDHRADKVGGKEVRCELDPAEFCVDDLVPGI